MTDVSSNSDRKPNHQVSIGGFSFHCSWILLILLLIQTGLIGHMAWRKSPTNDEIAHLPASVLYLQYQRFELYRVNPPLARLVSGIPVVLAGCNTDWSSFDPAVGERTEWKVGYDFVEANPKRYLWLLFLARMGCLPFAWTGTVILWVWCKDIGGSFSAILGSLLWIFSPTVLGNAALLTCDVPATAMGMFAGWRFYRWLRTLAVPDAFFAGMTAGLAMGTKTVWVILPAIWLPLWLAVAGRTKHSKMTQWLSIKGWPVLFGQPVVAAITCLLTLNTLYGFEGFGTRLCDYQFNSDSLSDDSDQRFSNRFTGTSFGALPVPLPKSFVQGIDEQRVDFESAHGGYLYGRHRKGGVWYYYLAAMIVKEPVCWLLLLAFGSLLVAKALFSKQVMDSGVSLSLWVAGAHGISILILVSWQSGLNSFYRYLLPGFPFAFLIMGALAARYERPRIVKFVMMLLVMGTVVESLCIWPHSLSFFNFAVGGPMNGGQYLLGSNLDWGQEIGELERWQKQHPEASPLYFIPSNLTPMSVYDIDWNRPPFWDEMVQHKHGSLPEAKFHPPPAGWYVLSPNWIFKNEDSTDMSQTAGPSCEQQYRDWFRVATPTDYAGYGLMLFHVPKSQNKMIELQ